MKRAQLFLTIGLVSLFLWLSMFNFQQSLNVYRKGKVDELWSEINLKNMPKVTILPKTNWTLVGSDPKTYKGPIVKGWPPGKSRNMSEIMVNDYIIEQCSDQDLSGIKLFIGVKTVSTRFEARDTTRETWASFQTNHPEVKVMFFSGEVENPQVMNQLRAEIQIHCDLTIVHGLDTYQNVTLKTVSILSYIHDQQLGLNPEMSMIMDDDAYLNLDRLYFLVSRRLLARPFDTALTGFVYGGTLMRPANNSVEQFTGNSVCPTYMYNGERFPDFLSGSGYVLPRAVIPCLYEQTRSLPFLHIDDVFVTGFCAEACGFSWITHSQFSPGHKNLSEVSCHNLVLHYQSTDERLQISNKLLKECPSQNPKSTIL